MTDAIKWTVAASQQWDTYEDWLSSIGFTPWRPNASDGDGPPNVEAMALDDRNRPCLNRADFQRARDEGTFPVRWLWPEDVARLAEEAQTLRRVERMGSMSDAPTNGTYIVLLYDDEGQECATEAAFGECDRYRNIGWRPRCFEADGSDEITEPWGWLPLPKRGEP